MDSLSPSFCKTFKGILKKNHDIKDFFRIILLISVVLDFVGHQQTPSDAHGFWKTVGLILCMPAIPAALNRSLKNQLQMQRIFTIITWHKILARENGFSLESFSRKCNISEAFYRDYFCIGFDTSTTYFRNSHPYFLTLSKRMGSFIRDTRSRLRCVPDYFRLSGDFAIVYPVDRPESLDFKTFFVSHVMPAG